SLTGLPFSEKSKREDLNLSIGTSTGPFVVVSIASVTSESTSAFSTKSYIGITYVLTKICSLSYLLILLFTGGLIFCLYTSTLKRFAVFFNLLTCLSFWYVPLYTTLLISFHP